MKVPNLNFTEECKTAFEKLKHALVTAPILRYPDFNKEFFLYCDNSDYSIGYILGQKDDEGRVVIHYGGHALRPAEINYPITHKEGLALVEGIKYYHIYLIGRKFTVLTDHQVLKSLPTNQDVSGRFLPDGQFTCKAMILTLFTSQTRDMVMLMHCLEGLILSPLNQKKMVMKFWQTYNFN